MADQSEELDAARIHEVATGGDSIRVQRITSSPTPWRR